MITSDETPTPLGPDVATAVEAGAVSATTATRRHRPRRVVLPYLLLIPGTAVMLLVHLVPMGAGIWMSLLHLNQAHLVEFLGAPFVGLQNYAYVLTDPLSPIRNNFLDALRNTLILTLAANLLTLVIGLAGALLISREFRGRGVARTFLLLPWVVPTYVVGLIFSFMWQPFGVVNQLLHDVLHLPVKPFWLVGPTTLLVITVAAAWRGVPQTMMLLAAGLTGIPRDLYEAAEVDGASAWQQLRYVTLPMLKPVIAVILLFGLIYTIYTFNLVFAMFGGNGYPGDWGDVLMTMIFRYSFAGANFGIGAAASVLLMAVCLGLVVIWYRVFRREVTLT
jgi:multiple sugar transport system permease protein